MRAIPATREVIKEPLNPNWEVGKGLGYRKGVVELQGKFWNVP